MFTCGLCGTTSRDREKPERKITARQEKTYTYVRDEEQKMSQGWEIKHEILICAGGCGERLIRLEMEDEKARVEAAEKLERLKAERKKMIKEMRKKKKDKKDRK